MPVNQVAYSLWCYSQSQWRVGAYGSMDCIAPIPCGMDYTGVRAVAEMLDLDDEISPAVFLKLKALEQYELKRIRRRITDNVSE